jgi:hypothetical protein
MVTKKKTAMARKKAAKRAATARSKAAAKRQAAGRAEARKRMEQIELPEMPPRLPTMNGLPLETRREKTVQTLSLTRGELADQRVAASRDGAPHWTGWIRLLVRARMTAQDDAQRRGAELAPLSRGWA